MIRYPTLYRINARVWLISGFNLSLLEKWGAKIFAVFESFVYRMPQAGLFRNRQATATFHGRSRRGFLGLMKKMKTDSLADRVRYAEKPGLRKPLE